MALQSVNFNGSSQYATCGDVPTSGLSAFTAEGWFYLDTVVPVTMGLLAKDGAGGQAWTLATANNSEVMFRVKNALGGTQVAYYRVPLAPGRWYHVAGVYTGAVVKVYVNGTAGDVAPAQSGLVFTCSQAVEIGRYSGGGYLDGRCGWARVSSTARYTANFVAPYLPPKVDANTQAQWNFTEGSGSSLDNITGSSTLDGALTGGPSWLTDTPWMHTMLDSVHTMELKVGGVDLWANLKQGSFRLKEGEGGQISTLDFELEETTGAIPVKGWVEVQWTVDGQPAFGGYVVKAQPTLGPGDGITWSVAAEGYATEFNKATRVRKTYVNRTPKAILQTLFTDEGLTAYDVNTHVTTGAVITSFLVNGEKFTEILDRLALVAGAGTTGAVWAWRVDAGRALWFGPATSDATPFGVATLASANFVSTFPALRSPTKSVDETDIRNRVTVTGTTVPSSPITEMFSGNGTTLIFALANQALVDVTRVTVNGVVLRHGVDWFNTYDQGYDVLVNYRAGTLRWDTGHAPPVGTNNIVIVYRKGTLVQSQGQDDASHTYYGRWFDYEIQDGHITTLAEANQIIAAVLALYSMPAIYGEVVVERWGCHAGQKMSIVFPLLNLNDSYVIQEMTTELLRDGMGVRCTVKYGGKQPKAAALVTPPGVGSGTAGGTLDPLLLLGGIAGTTEPRLDGEISIARVNDRVEVIDRATTFNDAGDYGDASGIVLLYDGDTQQGKFIGLKNGVVQAYFDSDGAIKAGGNAVIIDENGISLVEQGGAFPTPSRVRWFDASGHLRLDIGVSSDGSEAQLYGAEVPLTIGTYGAPNLPVRIATEYQAEIRLAAPVQVGADTAPDAKLDVAGNVVIDLGLVVNETGADADTRIEGDTDANLVFVDAGADRVGLGTAAPASKLHVNLVDAETLNVMDQVTLSRNSSGTPAPGYGSRMLWELKSSTTQDQAAAALGVSWVDSTHASRKARMKFSVWNVNFEDECLRLEASDDGPRIGFYGMDAVPRQTSVGAETSYKGIDNLQSGEPYASVDDLNALREAYEYLRGLLVTLGLVA